jgi:hypothetical protein
LSLESQSIFSIKHVRWSGKTLLLFEKLFGLYLTNNYATKCIEEKPDPKWKPTNVTEILAFIGLHVVMSVIQLPSYFLHQLFVPLGAYNYPNMF